MSARLRAPLAALFALLIGGDIAVRGGGALLDVGRFLFPYLWLFLAFEALKARRRLLDAEAFLVGAAVGLAHGGIYAKTLQRGIGALGIDWLAAATAAFDWGVVTVLALHAADAVFPRREGKAVDGPPLLELAALVFIAAGALLSYLFDTITGRYRFERMLGSTWLLADVLFAAAAALLARRALARARADEPEERDRGLWLLGAFCAWLPAASGLARLGGDWPGPVSGVLVAAWTFAAGVAAWRLWRERSYVDPEPRRSWKPALALAAWRLGGSVLLAALMGPFETNARAALAFSYLVDLPTRLVFFWAFFAGRVAV